MILIIIRLFVRETSDWILFPLVLSLQWALASPWGREARCGGMILTGLRIEALEQSRSGREFLLCGFETQGFHL